MLSKRLNDIIFIAIIVIVVAGIISARFVVLNQYDSRIENAENDIETLQSEILRVGQLVENNRQDQLMSMTEMYQYIPQNFDEIQIRNRILGELELNGITNDSFYDRYVSLPFEVTFTGDSNFATISDDLTMYRIVVGFTTDDIDVLNDFLDNMDSLTQYFVLQTLSYYPTDENPDMFRVEIRYITFYS